MGWLTWSSGVWGKAEGVGRLGCVGRMWWRVWSDRSNQLVCAGLVWGLFHSNCYDVTNMPVTHTALVVGLRCCTVEYCSDAAVRKRAMLTSTS